MTDAECPASPPRSDGDGPQPGRVGLIGATGLVGDCLIPLLTQAGWQVVAYSRQDVGRAGEETEWRRLPQPGAPISPARFPRGQHSMTHWICVAPIWALPQHFALLEASGARRVVALSSTSRFTKDQSSDPHEQAVAGRLAEAETRLQTWAQARGVEWVILRPTLIYGLGRDRNVAEIARFIRRFGFFPLLGQATGRRQPVHARDVAQACLAALQVADAANRAYDISGGETLTYRDMVCRIFAAMKRRPRLLPLPLMAFRIAVALLRSLPRYRHLSAAMAARMSEDLVFDHSDAIRRLGFKPRPFLPSDEDIAT